MTDGPRSAARLRVSVVDADGRSVRVPSLASWLVRVAPRHAQGSVTVALVSDARVRGLNRAYRGIDKPTDVLSFSAEPTSGAASTLPKTSPQGLHIRKSSPKGLPHTRKRGRALARRQRHLGDIVIARGVASRQARRARHSTSTELRILALHGLLHLLGYDHEGDDGRMARVERRLRRLGGLPAGLIERRVDA